MNNCPCCANLLLKHWKQGKIYWYCGRCRQEMPNLELQELKLSSKPAQTVNKVISQPISQKAGVALPVRDPHVPLVRTIKAS